jgi:hypothetical protein
MNKFEVFIAATGEHLVLTKDWYGYLADGTWHFSTNMAEIDKFQPMVFVSDEQESLSIIGEAKIARAQRYFFPYVHSREI